MHGTLVILFPCRSNNYFKLVYYNILMSIYLAIADKNLKLFVFLQVTGNLQYIIAEINEI